MEITGPEEQQTGCSRRENAKHRAKAGNRHRKGELWRDVKWAVIAFAGLCALNVLVFELHW